MATWKQLSGSLAGKAMKGLTSAYQYGAERNPVKAGEQYAQKYGVDSALGAYKAIANQALKTQGLLQNLEGNVNKRAQGQGLSEAMRSKVYATEQAPLAKQYSGLMTGAQTALTGYEQARQRWQDAMTQWQAKKEGSMQKRMAPYTALERISPLLESGYTSETPAERLALQKALLAYQGNDLSGKKTLADYESGLKRQETLYAGQVKKATTPVSIEEQLLKKYGILD